MGLDWPTRGPRPPAARSSRPGRGRAGGAGPRARSAPRPGGRSSGGRADRSRRARARRAGRSRRLPHVVAEEARLGVQEAVHERVGVGIVRVPAPDVEVASRRSAELEVLGHRLVDRADRESDLAEGLGRAPAKKAENSPKKTGWTAAVSSTVSRETVASTELSEAPPAPESGSGARSGRRVAEKARRDEAVRRDGEPSERPADEPGDVDRARRGCAAAPGPRSGPRCLLKATK